MSPKTGFIVFSDKEFENSFNDHIDAHWVSLLLMITSELRNRNFTRRIVLPCVPSCAKVASEE